MTRRLAAGAASHHLQVKGRSFRDLPLTKELAVPLEEWFAFLEIVKGVTSDR